MATFICVDDLYQSLIDECSSLGEKNFEMEESILETLFRDQKYDLILYALEKDFTLTSERIEQIKVSGDLKLYQYLYQHQKLELDLRLMELAVRSGNLTSKMSLWLEPGSNSKLETVKWLRENGCPWDEGTCYYAVLNGNMDVLKWIRENGCPWNKSICHSAAIGGHLEVLKWARENGCSWDEWTCEWAVRNGHLEVLKWAREHGCPWGEWICVYAAENGHLHVLKWLRENGCPWDKDRCLRSAKDYPEIQEWIKSN